MNKNENQKLWEIRRSDGRKVPSYTFDNKAEAEKCAAEMLDPKHPFTYRVVPVKPE